MLSGRRVMPAFSTDFSNPRTWLVAELTAELIIKLGPWPSWPWQQCLVRGHQDWRTAWIWVIDSALPAFKAQVSSRLDIHFQFAPTGPLLNAVLPRVPMT